MFVLESEALSYLESQWGTESYIELNDTKKTVLLNTAEEHITNLNFKKKGYMLIKGLQSGALIFEETNTYLSSNYSYTFLDELEYNELKDRLLKSIYQQALFILDYPQAFERDAVKSQNVESINLNNEGSETFGKTKFIVSISPRSQLFLKPLLKSATRII